jgi:hypothetical protein
MTTPDEADAPAPAQREAESAWGMKFALGAVGILIVVEFVLPGFVAAGVSRVVAPDSATANRTLVMLTPAVWLAEHSKPIGDFYYWEYELAGGPE